MPGGERGMRAVTADEFSALSAIGGIRGLVESVLPGLLFVTVFLIGRDLLWALVISAAVALITVAVRLVQRTPVSQAVGGVLGIAIGVFWAWRTGDATDFFAFGLWQNGIYLLVVLLLQLFGWPAVGCVVEMLRLGLAGSQREPEPVAPIDPDSVLDDSAVVPVEPAPANPFAGFSAWRRDADLYRRYRLATWFWVGLFALRLLVQLPLFLGGSVGWLGTARLLMGVPLWALVLYGTWAVIHRPRGAVDALA